MEEWRKHFMCLLEGMEGKVVMGERREEGERMREVEIEGLSRAEVRAVIKKLKIGKQRGNMGFHVKHGSMEDTSWKNWCGVPAIGYGRERGGWQ